MYNSKDLPVLLLDNSSMLSVINEGEFKCYNISFEEAGHIIDVHESSDLLKCFSNPEIESIIFDYIGIKSKDIEYKKIRNMRPGQNAIVFKLYVTPSETQPIIHADDGVEAKKIQNVYAYCQYLVRLS